MLPYIYGQVDIAATQRASTFHGHGQRSTSPEAALGGCVIIQGLSQALPPHEGEVLMFLVDERHRICRLLL